MKATWIGIAFLAVIIASSGMGQVIGSADSTMRVHIALIDNPNLSVSVLTPKPVGVKGGFGEHDEDWSAPISMDGLSLDIQLNARAWAEGPPYSLSTASVGLVPGPVGKFINNTADVQRFECSLSYDFTADVSAGTSGSWWSWAYVKYAFEYTIEGTQTVPATTLFDLTGTESVPAEDGNASFLTGTGEGHVLWSIAPGETVTISNKTSKLAAGAGTVPEAGTMTAALCALAVLATAVIIRQRQNRRSATRA